MQIDPEHKHALDACNQMSDQIEQVRQVVNDPFYYAHEQIGELKRRIYLAREEFKLQIDQEAETLVLELEEYERELEVYSKSNEIESAIKEMERKLDATKLNLDMWTRSLDRFFDVGVYKTIQSKCEKSIRELKDELDSFKETSMKNKYKESEKAVSDFEKIQISFDYKSPIEGECYAKLKSRTIELCIALRDGTLACGCRNGQINIWNKESQIFLRNLFGHTGRINYMIELSNGNLASASDDKTIKIWNTQSEQLLHSFEGHTDLVFGLEQLSNDGVFASGSRDQTIKIWNANTRELMKTIVFGENIRSFIWLRNGNLAVIVQSKLKILNSDTELVIQTIPNDNFEFMWLLPDGNLIIAQTDSNISIWDVNRWELLRTLRGHKKEIYSMELLDDGCLVSGSEDGEIKIWDPIKGRLLKSIKVDDEAVRSVVSLRNGRIVSVSGFCKFWK